MRYQAMHCRNCNQMIVIDKTFGKIYGSPIKWCPNCLEPYYDPKYTEIGVSGVRWGDTWKVPPRSIMLLLIGCILLFMGYVSYESAYTFNILGGIMLVVGLIAIAYNIANHEHRLENIEKERAESMKRLENQEYVKLLRRAGVIKDKKQPSKHR
jgi:hypothetical protein